MALWLQYVKAWIGEQKGQDLVEYALLLGLIALAVVAALTLGAGAISNVWADIVSELNAI